MLYEEIKKANVQALKDKDTVSRSFYSVLLNKIKLEEIRKRESSEELSDSDILLIIQKMVKELEDEKANYEKVNNVTEAQNISTQIALAKSYLPKMLTEEEIKEIILSLPDKSIGSVMKHFKVNFAGKCDMKMVQEVLKSL